MGTLNWLQQVGQAADMVLMAVGDENALDAVLVFQHIGEVGDDKIHAEHVGIREHQTAVNEDHISLALIQSNVFAHFSQTAQRADVHGNGRGIGLKILASAAAGGAAALFLHRLDCLLYRFGYLLHRLSRLLSRCPAGTLGTAGLCGVLRLSPPAVQAVLPWPQTGGGDGAGVYADFLPFQADACR